MSKEKPGDDALARLYSGMPRAEVLAALCQETGREWTWGQASTRAKRLGIRRKIREIVRPVLDEAAELVRAEYPRGDLRAIAAALTAQTGREWSIKAVHNVAQRLDLHREVDQRMFPPALGIPRPPRTIEADRLVLCSDLQIPFHDRELLADMLRVARRDRCDTLVLAGDLVECQALSKWDRTTPAIDWEKETDTASAVLYEFSQTFEHVYLIPGNHEYRLLKTLQGQLDWQSVMAGWEIWDILADGGRPTVDNIPVIYLGDWALICHPGNYSRVPGNVAAALASIHQRSVFAGHEHSMSLRLDVSGRHLCVGLGCMCQAHLMDYKQFNMTTHPTWNRGFWTVISQQPTPYIKGWYHL